MLIPATSENVAAPHCSDERAVNSQKTARGGRGVAKFCKFRLDFDEFWEQDMKQETALGSKPTRRRSPPPSSAS